MERQLLIIFVFFLFGISSCQSNLKITSNFDDRCNTNSSKSECIRDVIPLIEDTRPIPANVWENMILNNNYDQNINLDEKTQSYINNHIKDVDKFNKFLSKSYYFIYYVPTNILVNRYIAKHQNIMSAGDHCRATLFHQFLTFEASYDGLI